MENNPQPTLPSKQQISRSLQGSSPGPDSVSTFGQNVADPNAKGNTIEPKLAPAETYGILVLYVPSNFDVANQEGAINGIINIDKGFIAGLEIKSIEWLIPEWTKTKQQDELGSIRLARANRPEYHPKPSCNLGELSKHTDDVLSRDFAGTRRSSVEYLIEEIACKLRGRGGRGQGLPPDFRESPESIEQESVPFPGKPTGNSRGRNGKAPFGSDRYGVQVAAWAGCLKIKQEVQSDWGGDGSMQGQNFGWGQGGVITMHPE
ncbi:hypothetical protein HO133_003342 [Letharia lupina]|uniref:Uncharacterized protein n=1 Tax=Letharia lupina TaxID=560253 RepID=A0A8H6CBK2_9LECA|nr:uncharacterized protein HO133_003342 [Letharia lupina]KAF6220211.1 hypothetical protein HO133_003342 [Letharia lupina]